MDDLSAALGDARRARGAWLHWLDDGGEAAYEAYAAVAGPLAARLTPLVETLAEAGMFAVSAQDGSGAFLRMAVEEAGEEDGRFILYSGVVTDRSPTLPALDDLSGERGGLGLLLSPGTGDVIERLAALEAALRLDGVGLRADEAASIRDLLQGEVGRHGG